MMVARQAFPLALLAIHGLIAGTIAACVPLPLGVAEFKPVDRVVVPVVGLSKTMTLFDYMIFTDQPGLGVPPARGIRFPPGIYTLEAEDVDYRYFVSPQKIEYRIFRNGTAVDARFIPGGLFLAKSPLTARPPAGAYLSSNQTHVTLTWPLGAEFFHLQGQNWKISF